MPSAKKNTASKKTPVKKKAPAKKMLSKKIDKKSVKSYQSVRGMKDVLPKDEWYWMQMMQGAQHISQAYGFRYGTPPVLEPAQLFVKSIGKGTDVVDKEMYMFEDKDGSKVALRPEFTAGFARGYIGNGMVSLPQPVKQWTMGPLFRHDRPQAGRYRQFHQFNCEVIGERDPVIDAELICMSYNYLRDLGIEAEVYVNSIGSLEDRQNYAVELVGYLRSKRSYLSEESKKRITKNPFRVLDSKDEKDQEVIAEAPQIIDWLSASAKEFFMKVLEYLDELQIPYVLRPTLVRGLDYYSDTVFELYQEDPKVGPGLALGGGGRYDGLIESLGGREETPASGFAIGSERVLMAMKQLDQQEDGTHKRRSSLDRQIYFAQLGAQARRKALGMIERLRRGGILVGSQLSKGSLKAQLEQADLMGASHCVIIGQKEVQDETVIIRDMESGVQEIIDQKKLEKHITRIVDKT